MSREVELTLHGQLTTHGTYFQPRGRDQWMSVPQEAVVRVEDYVPPVPKLPVDLRYAMDKHGFVYTRDINQDTGEGYDSFDDGASTWHGLWGRVGPLRHVLGGDVIT